MSIITLNHNAIYKLHGNTMQQLNEIKLVAKKRERREKTYGCEVILLLSHLHTLELSWISRSKVNKFFVALATSISAVFRWTRFRESRCYSAYLLHSLGQAQNVFFFKLFFFLTVILRYKITIRLTEWRTTYFVYVNDLFLILRSSIIGRRADC